MCWSGRAGWWLLLLPKIAVVLVCCASVTGEGDFAHPPSMAFPPSPGSSTTGLASHNATRSFAIAHIAAPLVRHNIPGQAPFPWARARASLSLLQLALERAQEEGSEALHEPTTSAASMMCWSDSGLSVIMWHACRCRRDRFDWQRDFSTSAIATVRQGRLLQAP